MSWKSGKNAEPEDFFSRSGMHAQASGEVQYPVMPSKKKGRVWRIVFWVALVVFLGALAALGAIGFSYWQGQQTYKEIERIGLEVADLDVALRGAEPEEALVSEALDVDWEALRQVNPDIVAWVYMPGTPINYPIVQGDDDEYYLHHDFKGEGGWLAQFGTVFLSADNDPGFRDRNNIIYGHHMNDGSMFAAIADLGSAGEFNSHRDVYLLTPSANYLLRSFSLVHVPADDPLAQVVFETDEGFARYVQDKMDRSVVGVPADVPASDEIPKTFAFATCDNLASDGRWVLFAYVYQEIRFDGGAPASGNGQSQEGAEVADEGEQGAEQPVENGGDITEGITDEDAQTAVGEAAGEAAA